MVCGVRRWKGIVLALVLWLASAPLILAAQAYPIVVVQPPEAGAWDTLRGRIERLNLRYRPLALADLSLERLAEAKVLFLPNLTNLTLDQANAIQQWVDRGGKLIVSGPLGTESPPEVREALTNLVGAYWIEPLNIVSRAEVQLVQPWTKLGNSTSAVRGGSLVRPVGSTANIAATWIGGLGNPAVLVNEDVTYLGWQWGTTSPTFDRDWLAAAIERFLPGAVGNQFKVAPVEATAMFKELEGVLGRVESALLTSDARSTAPEQFPPAYRDAIARAQRTLKELPAMLKDGLDTQARAAWEDAIEDLWAHYPTSQLAALPEVRAIWLDRGTIVKAGSEEGLTRIFDRLAQSGINTVFFETVNAGYTIYPSAVAPAQNPLIRGWDPLAAAVRLAHERKMELHAWTWTFAAGNTRHNALIGKSQDFPGPVLAAHPGWAQSGRKGNLRPAGQPEYWMDPANPEVRAYLQSLYEEILTNYDVDGLQFDYIRYPLQKNAGQYFGYSPAARRSFAQLTGVDPIDIAPEESSLWALWNRFKAEQVSSFVAESAEKLRRIKPRLIVSAAVFPNPPGERLRLLQQDWEAWAIQGNIDLLVPMTYALNTRRLQQLVEPTLPGVKEAPVLILPSLNLMSLPQVQLRDQLQAVRDLPSGGYSLFAAAHLADNHQQMLAQASSASNLLPYRDPLSTALERFTALKREWDFLLDRKQIWVAEYSLSEWRAQSKRTQAALETLSKQPSAGWMRTAREQVLAIRQGLGTWLGQEKILRPYRLQTWENRLDSLDTLLRYAQGRLERQVRAARTGR